MHVLYMRTAEQHEEETPCKCSTLNVCTLKFTYSSHIASFSYCSHTNACVHTYVYTYTPTEIDPPGVSRFGRSSSVLGPMDQVFERKGKLDSPIVIYTCRLEQIAALANKRWSVL